MSEIIIESRDAKLSGFLIEGILVTSSDLPLRSRPSSINSFILTNMEQKLINAFATASTSPKYNKNPTVISFILQLGVDTKIINVILAAYKEYTKITPIPKIGLIIDYGKGKISDVSEILAEIISLGGYVLFAKEQTSSKGILRADNKATGSTSIKLESLSINLPRLAFESNKDETYFRARLALMMKPALSSMSLRKKDVSDLTRRGLNPVLANNTQFMQRSSISLIVNLVGLEEAVFNILGYKNNKVGKDILYKVIDTAVSVAKKKGKETGDTVNVCMIDSEGTNRFSTLDSEKYGKMSVLKSLTGESYSEGITIDGSEISTLTAKSDEIVQCNKIAKILDGGLLTRIQIANDAKTTEIKKVIEKASVLVSSFKPIKQVAICGNCGLKDEKLGEKCPNCKSPYIIN